MLEKVLTNQAVGGFKSFDALQIAYAELLVKRDDISEIRWEDLIEELDPEIQIDRERKTPGRKHQDHKIYNLKKEIEALQKQVRTLQESESVRYRAMERFIDERGLTDEFEAFYESVYASQYDDAEEGIDIISDDDFGEEKI